VIYAGFWPRFAAFWLDFVVMMPIFFFVMWGGEHWRLFNLYYFLPGTAFGLWYGVYLVRHFGGTPGKRLMKLRVVKVSGEPVTYREALLRYLPEWVLGIGASLAGIVALLNLTDTQYFAATSFLERGQVISAAMPSWNGAVTIALNAWIWGEFLVMLTNKKRRAMHDFIAGTVVIKDAQQSIQADAPASGGSAT
jgi:uncharacterized RDD family membrane protein YckC